MITNVLPPFYGSQCICSFIVPDMTYNVFGGTLNPTLLTYIVLLPEYCRNCQKGIYYGRL